MEGDYVYQALTDPRNVRVLVLEPASGRTDPLIARLEEVKLGDASYTALSYSWAMEDDNLIVNESWNHRYDERADRYFLAPGVSSLVKRLQLGGSQVLIGENLRDALRRLRSKDESPTRLWVDALCINQRGNHEKSLQVANMAFIYEHAAQVVAWLGEGEEPTNAAANIALQCILAETATEHDGAGPAHNWANNDWTSSPAQKPYWWSIRRGSARKVCTVCRKAGIAGTALPHTSRLDAVLKTMKHLYYDSSSFETIAEALAAFKALYGACRRWRIPGTNSRYIPPHDALELFSRRRYFNRRWVVQEVAVRQPGRVVFQYGAYKLAGNLLHLVRDLYFGIDEASIVTYASPMPPPRRGLRSPESMWNLCKWVQYCNGMDCFDPRDRLFALLGCLPHTTTIEPVPQADYTQGLVEAYGEFVKYLLCWHYIGVILENSNVLRGRSDSLTDVLPTWMPDLGNEFHDNPNGLRELEAEWVDALPSLSEDGKVLSCYLAYLGTLEAPCSSLHHDERYQIVWKAQGGRAAPGYTYHPDSLYTQNTLKVSEGEIVAHWHCEQLYRFGDVLCGSSEVARDYHCLRLVLHAVQDSDAWAIVGSFRGKDVHYPTNDLPEERRLFHLV